MSCGRIPFMDIKGAGGNPGGLWMFFGGLAMVVVGGYLLLNQVEVHSGFWSWWGGQTFGLTLLPLLVGIGFLFFDGKSVPGWILTVAGSLIILAGIIVNLRIYFQPTSLYNTLIMLVLIAVTVVVSMQTVGVGLVAAMLVTPAAAAYLLAQRLPAMMLLAGVFGGVSSIIGLYLSYYANIASGAAIVLTATAIFFVAFIYHARQNRPGRAAPLQEKA